MIRGTEVPALLLLGALLASCAGGRGTGRIGGAPEEAVRGPEGARSAPAPVREGQLFPIGQQARIVVESVKRGLSDSGERLAVRLVLRAEGGSVEGAYRFRWLDSEGGEVLLPAGSAAWRALSLKKGAGLEISATAPHGSEAVTDVALEVVPRGS